MSTTITPPFEPVTLSVLPIELTAGEADLLSAYRHMDNGAREFIGKIAAAQAERYPHRATPSLRLVAGGASKRP